MNSSHYILLILYMHSNVILTRFSATQRPNETLSFKQVKQSIAQLN